MGGEKQGLGNREQLLAESFHPNRVSLSLLRSISVSHFLVSTDYYSLFPIPYSLLLRMLLNRDVQCAGVAGDGQAEHLGGHAG